MVSGVNKNCSASSGAGRFVSDSAQTPQPASASGQAARDATSQGDPSAVTGTPRRPVARLEDAANGDGELDWLHEALLGEGHALEALCFQEDSGRLCELELRPCGHARRP